MKNFVGCCGFPISKSKYYKHFNIVELQHTFYQPQSKIETIRKWREDAPKEFEFILKA